MLRTCWLFQAGRERLLFFRLTGLPKAARISHLKLILCLGFYNLVGATSSDVIYVALPLYHMSGGLLGILGTFGLGRFGEGEILPWQGFPGEFLVGGGWGGESLGWAALGEESGKEERTSTQSPPFS